MTSTKKRSTSTPFPVGTGLKLNAYKTFRRRPGRLLNVLSTFSLRPVSKGFNPKAYQMYVTSYFFIVDV